MGWVALEHRHSAVAVAVAVAVASAAVRERLVDTGLASVLWQTSAPHSQPDHITIHLAEVAGLPRQAEKAGH